MNVKPTISLILLGIVYTSRAGLDLTPMASDYVSEGIKYQKLMFRDGRQQIEYYPPPSWTFHGSAERVQLTPPNKNFAEAVIEGLTLDKPPALDQKAVDAIAQRLIAELPPGSQFAKVEQEIENSVPLNGGPTFEVIISYQSLGEKFSRSVVLANVRGTQLIFRLTARKSDFESLHSQFKASIFSWHWLESNDSLVQSPSTVPSSTVTR